MDLLPASTFTPEQLTEIYNQTRVDYIVPMPMSVERMLRYINVYDVDLDASCVAMDGEIPLGLCMLGLRHERAWVTRLGVNPQHRRRGTGYHMMVYVLEQAQIRTVPVVYLEVIAGNEPALALFHELGFREIRELKILRRAPGLPPETNLDYTATTHDNGLLPEFANSRTWRPAWTNQTESLVNAGEVHMSRLINHTTETSGWVTWKLGALQLQRVIVGPDPQSDAIPAYELLYHLHSQFPALDSVAENVPADSPQIEAFYEHGYVESFTRIEMELVF